jgi:hypothetical protein
MPVIGLLRVPFRVLEVQPVTPFGNDVPLAELGADGHYKKCDDQRFILLRVESTEGKEYAFALKREEGMKLYNTLAEALNKLENCHAG